MNAPVPFNRIVAVHGELDHMREAVEGGHLSGAGPFSTKCERALTAITGATSTLLTTSCTHALEMACHLLELKPGDEVIVPSFTFVATAAAAALSGAVPVFCDIRPDTFCLDERLLDELVSPRTRALFIVHYAGVACEMDEITAWADRRGIAVVEDNAHGLFGSYRDRPLGSFGALSTLSFHETKNLACGEGGALQINRRDLVQRAEILREKGTNRSRFFRGEVDRYTWVDLGSSWVPSDLLAAFLWGQLEAAEDLQSARHVIWNAYAQRLAVWAAGQEFELQHVPGDREHPAHLFVLLAPDEIERDRFLDHLGAAGVMAVFHYVPLHSSPAGRTFGRTPLPLPVTESVSERLVRLPLWAGMTDHHVDRVVDAVSTFRCQR